MEIGIGFLVGLFAGAIVALIAAVIIAVSRRAVAKRARTRLMPQESHETAHHNEAGLTNGTRGTHQTAVNRSAPSSRATQTLIVEQVDSPDIHLNKSLKEVRELLLQLADVISSTENASGEATLAFNSARDVIGTVHSEASPELIEAQRLLVDEIDRVLKSNAKLHSELDRANRGIAEQRRQIEELRVQARIDSLTKIPNRAAFDERLTEYVGLLERAQMLFSLLLIDIDFFKNVNDEYGHLNGDRILRGVANRIGASIRTNDFAARYGGEEFAVILPATDLTEAAGVAERVRQDIAKTNFRLDDKNIKMTISGGLARSAQGMSAEDIIAAADAALYQAKSSGRNKIVVNTQ